jgi:hypothetical protein
MKITASLLAGAGLLAGVAIASAQSLPTNPPTHSEGGASTPNSSAGGNMGPSGNMGGTTGTAPRSPNIESQMPQNRSGGSATGGATGTGTGGTGR